jgi:transposase
MDDTLLLSPASFSIAELLTVNRQLWGELAGLSARLDQVESENRELRRDTAILKCEVGYWKSRHADALLKIQERDLLIEQLQAEVKQLKSRQFGRRTEKSSRGSTDRSNTLPGEEDATPPPVRKRGRQPGQKAPERRGYEYLPVVEELIVLPAEQCVCEKCGAPRIAQGTEDSEQIEIDVKAYRRRFRRQRYRRGCQCPDEPVTISAPVPEKLIPKGMLGTSVFVDLLLAKYQVHQPVERWLLEWRQNDLDLAKGTVFDGLRRLEPLLQPIHQAILQRAAAGEFSHADETRWLMFAEIEGKASHQWWMWAFLGGDAIGYRLDPSRSHAVPERHFATAAKVVLMVDRYSAYKAMDQVKQGLIVLAFCWAHVRRDFVEVGKGSAELVPWALTWLRRIRDLYRWQRLRLQHSDDRAGEPFVVADAALRQALSDMQTQAASELAQGDSLREPCRKVLASLQVHWQGLTRFVNDLRIPLDNNRAERAMRIVGLGRKNYSGSTSRWSGTLAAAMFSIIATLSLNGLNPRKWLTWYLTACAGCQVPSDVSPYLPWNLSPEHQAELSLRPPTTS